MFQRDSTGGAIVPFKGRFPTSGVAIEARFIPILPRGKAISALARSSDLGAFTGQVRLRGGWYSIEVRALRDGKTIAEKFLNRIGVGEVFIIMGHSVAQGGELNLPGAQDERVQTIALDDAEAKLYEKSARSADLPPAAGSHFKTGVRPAPFGHGTYFWAQFAEQVTLREGIPVLLLNAGFGGTTLEHWAKSARREFFEHSFIRSDLQMPYANLKNALTKYAKLLGVRAILSDHGQNDVPQMDSALIFQNYSNVIAQARTDLGFPDLAVVVNRQTPYSSERHVRRAQERVIRELHQCFPGPDYDSLAEEDRPDRIHLSMSGMQKAASLWAEALSSKFF